MNSLEKCLVVVFGMWVARTALGATPPLVEVGLGKALLHTVVPVGDQGVVLMAEFDGKGGPVTFARYDTELKQVWASEWIHLDYMVRTALGKTDTSIVSVYRTTSPEFVLVDVALADGSVTASTWNPPAGDVFDEIHVQGEDVYLCGRRHVLHLDRASNTLAELDLGLLGTYPSPLGLSRDPDTGALLLTATSEGSDGDRLHLARVVGDELTEIHSFTVPEGVAVRPVYRFAPRDGGAGVVGSWGSSRSPTITRGFFLADGGAQVAQLYRFTDLSHFLDGARRPWSDRVRRTADRPDSAPVGLPEQALVVHPGYRVGDRRVLILELYDRAVRFVDTVGRSPDGALSATSVPIHTGWTYSRAFVVGIGPAGERLWDAVLPLGDTTSGEVAPRVRAIPTASGLELTWWLRDRIQSVTVTGDGPITDVPPYEGASGEAAHTWGSHADPWYDDWFLVYAVDRRDELGEVKLSLGKVHADADAAPELAPEAP